MKNRNFLLASGFALSLFAVPGCGSDDADSAASGSCTIVDLGDGTSAIRCPDGTEIVVQNGKDGDKGEKGDKGEDAACTLGEEDGKYTLTCGDKTIAIGDSCPDGFPLDVIAYGGSTQYAYTLALFQASNCTWVRGDVILVEYAEFPAVMRRIEKVDGVIEIAGNTIESIEFPKLAEVGGYLAVLEDANVKELKFPALRTVGEVLAIDTVDKLVSMDFSALESVGDWLYVLGNDAIETVSFPALKSVVGIHFEQNEALVSVGDFAALEEIVGAGDGTDAEYALVHVSNHPALTSFGKLGSVSEIDGHVAVFKNPELPQEDVDALFDAIDVKGQTYFCENKGGDACLD